MIHRPDSEGARRCQTCGVDITSHARYTHWTQCSLCYWSGRLGTTPPLEKLLSERAGLKGRLRQTEEELQRAVREHLVRQRIFQAATPWWKKVLGIAGTDGKLLELGGLVGRLRREAPDIQAQLTGVESSIKTARHIRKQFDAAARGAAIARERERERREGESRFDGRSKEAVAAPYDRGQFTIRKKDYKRGNKLDNHFRGSFADPTLDAFSRRCLFCGSQHDLTLDHFGLPKNEGRNFVLALRDGGIRMNVVVLCRSCNAAKGEVPYGLFFEESKLPTAIRCHERLLELVINDAATMRVIREWYQIHL